MIHIDKKPEPEDFDAQVRQPGCAFLERCPSPNNKQWPKHNYWKRCSAQLYQIYGGICAYSGQWFSRTVSVVSVDHFYPKSIYPEKAYEWENYRLTTQIMNNYKGDKMVVDPFEIANGDFILDFPSCLIKPKNGMAPAIKNKVKSTIDIFHFNSEEQTNQRCEIIIEYISGNISKQFLQVKYPFIASELERQDLWIKIREIIKIPT